MKRATALLLLALVAAGLSACGDKEAGATVEQMEAARADATEALDAVSALEDRIGDLEGDLRAGARATDKLAERLDDAIADLRASLKAVRADAAEAADAAAAADDALAQISSVARRLSVLEDRYDYHLKRYHGGG